MPSILPPISLPLLIHTRPIPIPHTFRSQPTHLLPPSHSPSVRSPLSFRPQPTPRPSPAPSPLSVTHRTCSPVTMSSTTSNIFPCPLVLLSTCHIPRSPLAYNLFTRLLVNLSTCPLLPELVHLLPCLFSHTTCSLVPPSTRQLTMLLIELVHLLPCLFSPPTCSPVPLSPVFLPCQHHLLPPYSALTCKLFLSSYFFVGTCLKHCNANSSLFVTHFFSRKRNYQ